MSIRRPNEYYRDHAHARRYLSQSLQEGTLTLFLGAGTAVDLGLPTWHELVQCCADRMNVSATLSDKSTSEDLEQIIRAVEKAANAEIGSGRTNAEYIDLVRGCLYRGVELPNVVPKQTPLLMALGALLMGARRGSVRRVVTFNFDSTLEWYLHIHGVTTQVVSNLPCLLRNEDVHIYHPHGFLPFPNDTHTPSDFLIFSVASIDRRIAREDPWKRQLENLLSSGVGLFLGLSKRSLTGNSIRPFLRTASDAVKETRPTGFWVFDGEVSDEVKRTAEDLNLAALAIPRAEIPAFLFSICQQAATDLVRNI